MFIAIAAISILAITGITWLFNRILAFKICPICMGVSGTWLWMLAAKFLNYEIDLIIPAMLMGGSVVGIAYQIEKRLPSNRSPLLWKTLFIPIGFVAVYSVVSLAVSPSNPSWRTVFVVATTFLVIVALKFIKAPRSRATESDKTVAAPAGRGEPRPIGREELEKKMKNCC